MPLNALSALHHCLLFTSHDDRLGAPRKSFLHCVVACMVLMIAPLCAEANYSEEGMWGSCLPLMISPPRLASSYDASVMRLCHQGALAIAYDAHPLRRTPILSMYRVRHRDILFDDTAERDVAEAEADANGAETRRPCDTPCIRGDGCSPIPRVGQADNVDPDADFDEYPSRSTSKYDASGVGAFLKTGSTSDSTSDIAARRSSQSSTTSLRVEDKEKELRDSLFVGNAEQALGVFSSFPFGQWLLTIASAIWDAVGGLFGTGAVLDGSSAVARKGDGTAREGDASMHNDDPLLPSVGIAAGNIDHPAMSQSRREETEKVQTGGGEGMGRSNKKKTKQYPRGPSSSSSSPSKRPRFAKDHLVPAHLQPNPSSRRERVFAQDSDQPQYAKNKQTPPREHWDKGHLAPNAIMKYVSRNASLTFIMTNVASQAAWFNQKPWERLERRIRRWVRWEESPLGPDRDLYAITGVASIPACDGHEGHEETINRGSSPKPCHPLAGERNGAVGNVSRPDYYFTVLCDANSRESVGFYGRNSPAYMHAPADQQLAECPEVYEFVSVQHIEEHIYGQGKGSLFPAKDGGGGGGFVDCNTHKVNQSHWWSRRVAPCRTAPPPPPPPLE